MIIQVNKNAQIGKTITTFAYLSIFFYSISHIHKYMFLLFHVLRILCNMFKKAFHFFYSVKNFINCSEKIAISLIARILSSPLFFVIAVTWNVIPERAKLYCCKIESE